METNDHVSYELAKKLEKCGFDEPCDKGIRIIPGTEREEWDEEEYQWCTVKDIEYYPKITLWQAQKWLREKKEIFVEVTSEALHDWDFFVMELDEDANVGYVRGSEIYPSYEQALSAGISAALELIKPAHQ